MLNKPASSLLVILLANFLAVALCYGGEGLSDDEISLGMSNALTGPTAQLGIKLKQGSQAYFDEVNKKGGVHGRQLSIISLDDGYEPQNTVANTRKLIYEHKVFALFGYVGTPTSFAIMPLLKDSNIPFLMPFTGADFLREPQKRNIFNLRASYFEEATAQINYLLVKQKIDKIGLLIQADEFGLAVEQGLLKAMSRYDIEPVITVRYQRNTEDIYKALETLAKSGVEAVSFVGTYTPFIEFINSGFDMQFTPFYTTVSFVSSHDLFSRLKYPARVLVTEVLPDPSQCKVKICQKFNLAMAEAGISRPDQVHFEGYLNAYVFAEAAKRCGKQLSRACLMDKLENFQADFQGIAISFSPQKHQGLSTVYYSFYTPGEKLVAGELKH
jgi:branched-chain amino acid transport system substrate-binding protein